ncbi:single-stranded DNA-binding protein [Nocardioides caeni]|uniref:Single-stranded DNA-binding protein n=1 Tax=Nocardioides caeni TaxID=574700 RepID=A0A4S8N249_9ACTN|nr:single-stranded DNA-binding protein [Nocardioides caeni]THV09471.1 single-stranded DNA-binding protein [Nocardioides caeni]
MSSNNPNEVRLVGRVSAAPETRALPSGDQLCLGRLVVPRPETRILPSGRKAPSVDVIDLTGWSARARRSMSAWSPGDEVEVTGALRRRFYRAGGSTASRVEVEVTTARRLRRAASG